MKVKINCQKYIFLNLVKNKQDNNNYTLKDYHNNHLFYLSETISIILMMMKLICQVVYPIIIYNHKDSSLY